MPREQPATKTQKRYEKKQVILKRPVYLDLTSKFPNNRENFQGWQSHDKQPSLSTHSQIGIIATSGNGKIFGD